MSKNDLLTDSETELAAKQGWTLVEVYDAKTKRVGRQVLPLKFTLAARNADIVTRYVIAQAKAGNPTALRALQLISQGHTT
jgi:hypothetical protein